ncbi:putative xylogalacturonan beta-1,3-xylosyltransferase [Helianthus annuus]|nr:putative xylogalacturonan beta-1,3-xylosyltransferase [Helianthus annuus]
MGHEVQYILESKRLVWLVAVVFAVVIMFQYFEFPYGDVSSSMFSMGRSQPSVGQTGQTNKTKASAESPTSSGNITVFNVSNHTTPVDTHGKGGIEYSIPSNDSTTASLPPTSSASLTPPKIVNITVISPSTALDNNTSKPEVNASNLDPGVRKPATSENNPAMSAGESPVKEVPPVKAVHKRPIGDIVTLADMHDILSDNRASVRSMKPLWSSTVDQELLDAKQQIENAPVLNHNDRALYPPLYRNVSRFKRSYELMEKILKVYVYKEGEKPIFHQPQAVLSGIYASEGWFMKHMKENKHFVTNNPKQAHLFYLPFSSRMLEEKLYVTGSGSRDNLVQRLKDYVQLIAGRYDSWNRTGGSDHFLVACHDWATDETRKSMNSCIRALCNSDVGREHFELGKDVSLAETYVRSPQNPLRELGGKPPSQRSILAFFAGQMHGDVRPILLKHWENKDPDMKIFRKLPNSKGNKNYINYMKTSKYCICAKGYEVNSPRVVEAIFHECVPVIISDNFVPPFFEILNWEAFAVFVQEKDIPNLKNILLSISNRRYLVMQQRVKKVQQHFLWHVKPVKYDIFHMILHSVWYNRVFRV